MKTYKVIYCEDGSQTAETEMNKYASQGYVLEKFKVSCTAHCCHVVILMSKDIDTETEKI